MDDRQLQDHLHHCPQCAREAKAVKALRHMLDSARENIAADFRPMAEQKELVSRRVDTGRTGNGHSRLSPVVGFGLAAVLTVITFLTLIPFNYTRTVGYEIAFDGVDKELADDVEGICDILFSLGLDQADVDILGCDSTCSLLIVDLKSPEEVEKVIAAFTDIDPSRLTSNVIPVQTRASGTLLDQANETIRHQQMDIN
ncbi:MAG: hypothetical protein GY841_20350 [FCB group bacterium]|nr:hypothetical protein [FCB group bacterium]